MKKYGTWMVEDIEVDDIKGEDYPDFCDAYISSATVNGKEATEEQLDILNSDGDFLYECITDQVF